MTNLVFKVCKVYKVRNVKAEPIKLKKLISCFSTIS